MNNYSNISYIYGLSSSNDKDNIRYIGVSSNPKKRLQDHIQSSKRETTKVYKWIKSHREKGDKILLNILGCFNENEIYNKETEFILKYRSQGNDLMNHNDGGLGGIRPDEETRIKLHNAQLGNKKGLGKIKSQKEIERISKFFKNKSKTENQLKAFKEVMNSFYKDEERVRLRNIKIGEANKGIPRKNRLFTEEKILKLYQLHSEGKGLKEISNLETVTKTQLNNLFYNSRRYSDIKKKYNLVLNKQRIK